MKKYPAYRILLWVSLIIMGACTKVDSLEHYSGSYNVGKQSFEYLENNMASLMSFFDLALRMDAFLEKAEEEPSGENVCFLDYELMPGAEGQWLGVKAGDTVFSIASDGLDLTTESAVWRLKGERGVYRGEMTVTCTAYRTWTLEMESVVNGNWVSDAHLKVQCPGETLPVDFNGGDWMVSGSGMSVSWNDEYGGEKMILNFDIAESLIKISGSRYLFDKGTLFINISDLERQKKELAKAELKSIGHGRQLKITYKNEVYLYNDEADFALSPVKE